MKSLPSSDSIRMVFFIRRVLSFEILLTFVSPLERHLLLSQPCQMHRDRSKILHKPAIVADKPYKTPNFSHKARPDPILIYFDLLGSIITLHFKPHDPKRQLNSHLENLAYNLFSKNTPKNTEIVDMLFLTLRVNYNLIYKDDNKRIQ